MVENSAIAVGHGSDSRRIARQQLAGRVVPEHGIDAADPLGDLTAAEIEPVLRACGDADILALRLLTLDNGIPVVCRHAPGDTEWQLTGWRRGEPVAAARPGKRPGICYLYDRTAAFDPAPAAEGRRPKPWAFGATFSLAADGLYRFAAAGPRDEAASIATSLAARLERDDFNISAWTASLDSVPATCSAAAGMPGGAPPPGAGRGSSVLTIRPWANGSPRLRRWTASSTRISRRCTAGQPAPPAT